MLGYVQSGESVFIVIIIFVYFQTFTQFYTNMHLHATWTYCCYTIDVYLILLCYLLFLFSIVFSYNVFGHNKGNGTADFKKVPPTQSSASPPSLASKQHICTLLVSHLLAP